MILTVLVTALLGWTPQDPADSKPGNDLAPVQSAMKFAGLSMTDEELAQLLPWATDNIASFEVLRGVELENGVAPATVFMPLQQETEHPGWQSRIRYRMPCDLKIWKTSIGQTYRHFRHC